MADTIRRVQYFYATASNKPGEGNRLLEALRQADVSLRVFHGFPSGRQAQIDFVPADPVAFVAAAKSAKIKISRPKTAFHIEGDDRIGAVADVMAKLGRAKINVTAITAVCAGLGRYGAILWVKPRDVKKAATILEAV